MFDGSGRAPFAITMAPNLSASWIRLVQGRSQANEASPILAEEGRVAKIEGGHALADPAHMSGDAVIRLLRRLVTAPEPDLVRRDRTITGSDQMGDLHPTSLTIALETLPSKLAFEGKRYEAQNLHRRINHRHEVSISRP